jgi:hypothetical protein
MATMWPAAAAASPAWASSDAPRAAGGTRARGSPLAVPRGNVNDVCPRRPVLAPLRADEPQPRAARDARLRVGCPTLLLAPLRWLLLAPRSGRRLGSPLLAVAAAAAGLGRRARAASPLRRRAAAFPAASAAAVAALRRRAGDLDKVHARVGPQPAAEAVVARRLVPLLGRQGVGAGDAQQQRQAGRPEREVLAGPGRWEGVRRGRGV